MKKNGVLTSAWRRAIRALAGLSIALCSVCLLIWPGIELVRALHDPLLAGPEPAAQTWRWHRALTPAFEEWAERRQRGFAATRLTIYDISGTEWPLFSAVYYLRATENLDRAWQRSPHDARPADYARRAIDAAAGLLADPKQASWVQAHWGENEYLHRENVFYRMLLIDGLATQAHLLGSTRHVALLRSQVEGLAAELSAAPTGLLADYPGQTFPADVAAAWHAILRADKVLGTDHREAARHALRGFIGVMAPDGDLPPYAWFGNEPAPTDIRGSANSWLLHHAPFVWPTQAQIWFNAHNNDFWQQGRWLAGYREFALSADTGYYHDVDSGPVIAGLGTSATAFGVGAARSMGAVREARVLGILTAALSWPLPNGRLLAPRLLSDLVDAPLLGEAAILYNLSQPPASGFPPDAAVQPAPVPWIVWIILAVQWLSGILLLWIATGLIRRSFDPH